MGICSHFRLGTRPYTRANFISAGQVSPSASLAVGDGAEAIVSSALQMTLSKMMTLLRLAIVCVPL